MSRTITICLGLIACLSSVQVGHAQQLRDAADAVPLSKAVSRAAEAAFDARALPEQTLAAAIEEVLSASALASARVGIAVVSLDTGETVYARNADELLNPASNVKLFTAAAALSLLGPGFQFDTEFFSESPLRDGPAQASPTPSPKSKSKSAARRHLYVRGGGDPTLTSETLWRIANDLYNRGLRQVTGDIVLDESFFDGERVGAGYDQETTDRAYMAPPGALSLNWNAIGIHVAPASQVGQKPIVTVDPESDFIVVENKATTTGHRSLRRLSLSSAPSPDGQKQVVTVSGRIPVGGAELSAWRKIDDPGLYFGQTLKRYLKMRGIQVKGRVRRGAVPSNGVHSVLLHRSETLDAVLKRLNKNSSNVVSEQLIKTLGAKIFGAPGSWRTGLYAIEHFLKAEVGLKPGTYVMKNGSGLNDVNRFSAHQITALLLSMWRNFPIAPEFLSSLGIAAQDGTLQYRMEGSEAERRLRAKTGTLENVSALSGYVQTMGGERLAFAVVANDFPGRAGKIVPVLDALGAVFAAQGAPPEHRLAGVPRPTTSLASLADLREDLLLFSGIASERDPRNLPQLFAALKTERDPALRAIVADALYQSDPANPHAVRALLEHADPRPEAFGRLVSLARAEKIATPLLPSLLSLAAEGDADALAKIVEIAGLSGSDLVLAAELQGPLLEVARNAAEELLTVLEAALPRTRAGALALLANGLRLTAAEAETDVGNSGGEGAQAVEAEAHPFPQVVSQRLRDMTDERAEFAAQLRQALGALLPGEAPSSIEPVEAEAGAASGEAAVTTPTAP
ncbi:MAG: D-alanyl-D-alanine carboxypeptidase/D-alanyl-D-alanine-endopeptidase [Myxococcales bacterium]|jgi:D-alanyl-D-alanine carboxypeptidase/D-alanyl-D-alanine-endopeptidase (penicillin-binding protein 4)|nr:D-alanyl-D-alanine carboxypeptidase/D-alanyl-D-alanine-endopeptidase [Myxococcales bacterium]